MYTWRNIVGVGIAFMLILTGVRASLMAQSSEGPGCRVDPANPSIGTDIPLSYFGPPATQDNPSFVGSLQLLRSGQLDPSAGTITLPLYRGEFRDGRNVWFILTDTTDAGNAKALGLNFAPKLAYAATGRGARTATLRDDGVLIFDQGTVDFSPVRRFVPGPAERPFPPAEARPGSRGDQDYSPLVVIQNAGGHVYNAPMIAFDATLGQIACGRGECDYSRVHDRVLAINKRNQTVTMRLVPGFSFARPILYLTMDSNNPVVAALEDITLAPGLNDIDVGNDDSAFSGVERIFITLNGPEGCRNPQRQGIFSAINDGRSPLNVLGGIPTLSNDYSPLWDANVGEWTQEAVTKGFRTRVLEEFQILTLVEEGFITGPGGAPYGSIGTIINCPIVFRFL
jgi:hypothetical protein